LMLLPFLSWLQFVFWYFKNSSFAVLVPLKMHCLPSKQGKETSSSDTFAQSHRTTSPTFSRIKLHFISPLLFHVHVLFLALRLPHCGKSWFARWWRAFARQKPRTKEADYYQVTAVAFRRPMQDGIPSFLECKVSNTVLWPTFPA
jgi:hypothetical protein